jgi:hypothetical protein
MTIQSTHGFLNRNFVIVTLYYISSCWFSFVGKTFRESPNKNSYFKLSSVHLNVGGIRRLSPALDFSLFALFRVFRLGFQAHFRTLEGHDENCADIPAILS